MNFSLDKKSLIFIIYLMVMSGMSYTGEKAKIKMVREIWLPESWEEAELSVINRYFNYTPPRPVFGKQDVGVVFTTTVKGIKKTVTIKWHRIGKATFVKDRDGRLCKIEQNKTYKINGNKYKAIGESNKEVYFKSKKQGHITTAEKVNLREYIKEIKKRNRKRRR